MTIQEKELYSSLSANDARLSSERHAPPPAPPPANETLRARLLEMREAVGSKWSNNKFAARLGCSPAVISQYLSADGNKYPGDVALLERKIDDFLRNESRRRASGIETSNSDAARDIATAFEFIRKTNAVGAILAESGEGKTRGIELYLANNPLAVVFPVRQWSRDLGSIEGAMFQAVGSAGYDRRTKRSIYLVQKLRGTDRLIIVDDAHKLTGQSLQWLFDFHDDTDCPLALVGTFALDETLNADPQRSSRVGISYPVRSRNSSSLIEHMVRQLIPNIGSDCSELCDLCEDLASAHGHYRNIHQQLKLAIELKEGSPRIAWPKAFEQAAAFMPHRTPVKPAVKH